MKLRNLALHTIVWTFAVTSASLSSAQEALDLSKTVSFRSVALTAKEVLKRLSEQTGVPLVTSTATANDVLLIDVREVKLSDLMTRIASAVGAEWKQDSEGWRLVRPQALIAAQDKEYLSYRAEMIKRELDRLAKDLEKRSSFGDEDARKAAEETRLGAPVVEVAGSGSQRSQSVRVVGPSGANNSPVMRALDRILVGWNPTDLAAIPQGSRTVFALTPTAMQRRLPAHATKAIQQFAVEQQRYAQAASEQPTEVAEGLNLVFFGQDTSPRMLQGGVAEALLIVFRAPNADPLQVELKIADQTGRFVAQGMRIITPSSVEANQSANVPAGASRTPIPLSQKALEHAKLMSAGRPTGGQTASFAIANGQALVMRLDAGPGGPGVEAAAPVTPEWRQTLASPVLAEPLGFAASELFLGLGEAEGAQLVASLPDTVLTPLSRRALQPVTATDLEVAALNQLGLTLTRDSGWLVVRPRFHSFARWTRVDRTALGRMLQDVLAKGRLSLDALATYATGREIPRYDGLDTVLTSLVDPSAGETFSKAIGNWRIVQLYARLDPQRRQALSRGSALPLGLLAPDQATLVHAMVFSEAAGPYQVEPPQRPRPGPGGRPQRQIEETRIAVTATSGLLGGATPMFASSMSGLMDERTEYLPNGVPRDGVLTMSWQNERGVLAASSGSGVGARTFSAQEYGTYMALGQGGGPFAGMSAYDRFRPAVLTRMDFMFRLTPQAAMSRQLSEVTPDVGSGWVAFEQLPQGFREQAERAMRRMQEMQARARSEGGQFERRAVPPPPSWN